MGMSKRGILTIVLAASVGVGVAWRKGAFTPSHAANVASAANAPSGDGGAPVALRAVRETTNALARFAVTMPTATPVTTGQNVRMTTYAWNAHMGGFFANGGPVTTTGSLMAQRGVRLTINRDDNTDHMKAALVTCANELSQGAADCQQGIHFFTIMGDGAAAILHGLNQQLARLGPDYVAEIVASHGYSRGEDGFYGPRAWRDNPESARGGTIIGVLRDGDWNLAELWAESNNICVNDDPTTYNPRCLNWMGIADYLDAVRQYNANACEERPVINDQGQRNGRMHHVCPDAAATWTPGDVMIMEGPRNNVVAIFTTRQNPAQMPNAVVGLRRWNRTHRSVVVGMIAAMGLGGLAVNTNRGALDVGADVSRAIYGGAETPTYWRTMFLGEDRLNRATGETIHLGGSKANSLADMMELFGLNPGAHNAFEATYTTFGRMVQRHYPAELETFEPFAQVSDTSYLLEANRLVAAQYGATGGGEVERPTFNQAQAQTAPVIARRDWNVTFQTGSAGFTPAATATLEQLRDQLVLNTLFIEVHGYTDNVGNPDSNMVLSQQRASAVRSWLMANGGTAIPTDRITARGHGQTGAMYDNGSEAGRAANRRVSIVLRDNNTR